MRWLGVKEPDLTMFITELEQLALEPSQLVDVVKGLIKDISALNPHRDSLHEVLPLKAIPVKSTDGTVSLRHAFDTFVIVDHLEYGEIFKSEVDILDFTMEEVRQLQPLISA